MITFDAATKRYPDGTMALDALDLEAREGEVTVLIGPSGCGKTTTLRLVNRMVEPSEGRVRLDGEDVARRPTHELRRGIGYVIQEAGLFPHRTVAGNIGVVPRLLGWDRRKVQERVDELLELVGLPGELRGRFPHQLSGGQRQRVGVARALAADPPVLLMDEPFGAVDPVVRATLQKELTRLQQVVRKTIVFVTHDLDEALALGDRVAVLREGALEQVDAPQELLRRPATPFVEEFLGGDRELRRLGLIAVREVAADPGPVVAPGDDAATARRVSERHGTDWAMVVAGDRRLLGWVWIDELDGAARVEEAPIHAPELSISAEDTLHSALNALLATRIGVAVRVGSGGTYEGLLTQEILSREVA